jgi:hypothetical protein
MPVKLPEEYREEARRVRAMADDMDRAELRQTVHEIADLYERLAENVETVLVRQAPSGIR